MRLGLVLKALVFAALVLLSGCTVKFAYNNLDRMVRWQVADYVDLTDEQAALLDEELAEFILWHRTTHLPLYADRAEAMASGLNETVGEDDMQALYEQAMIWSEEVEARGMPMVVALLASLTPEQMEALPEAMEKSNVEFAEDEVDLTLSEAQAEWRNRVSDGLKFFAGRLTREQKRYLAEQSVRYQPEYVLWVEYRRRWQAALLKTLEIRGDSAAFDVAFRRLVDERESYWGEAFTSTSRANEQLGREVLVGLLARLSDKQTERFQEKLLALAEDFRELATEVD